MVSERDKANPYEAPPVFEPPPVEQSRHDRPRHIRAVLLIGAVSFGLAKLFGPNAPYALFFTVPFLFVFGAIAYVVGVANGLKAAKRK